VINGSKGHVLFLISLRLCDSVVQCSWTRPFTLSAAHRGHEKEHQGQQQRLGQPTNDRMTFHTTMLIDSILRAGGIRE
jgi:hypothetical protein